MHLSSKIFQHLGHFSPFALNTSIFISVFSDKTFSALEVIKYSAKSKFFNNSNLFLLTLNLTSASRLDPISLDDLFPLLQYLLLV